MTPPKRVGGDPSLRTQSGSLRGSETESKTSSIGRAIVVPPSASMLTARSYWLRTSDSPSLPGKLARRALGTVDCERGPGARGGRPGSAAVVGCAYMNWPNQPEEYRRARDELLQAEIELRRQEEAVAAQRRALPLGGEVTGDYVVAKAPIAQFAAWGRSAAGGSRRSTRRRAPRSTATTTPSRTRRPTRSRTSSRTPMEGSTTAGVASCSRRRAPRASIRATSTTCGRSGRYST